MATRAETRFASWRTAGWSALGCALLIPAIAMQFTSEVNWGPGDFLVMAALLGALGLGCEAAMRLGRNIQVRVLACLTLAAIFLLVWAELAVGIVR